MAKLPHSAKKDSFALDIGSSTSKVLRLQKQGRTWVATHAGQSLINRSMMADRSITDTVALGTAVKQAIKNSGVKTKYITMAIPTSKSTSKELSIPQGMSEMEQEDFVQLEINDKLGLALDDIKADFEILGSNPTDPKQIDIRVVAVKNDDFQTRVDTAQAAGCEVDVMDIERFAIERAMRFLIEKDPIKNQADPIEALIDIGHEFSVIHVLINGRDVYEREQSFGMKHLLDEVQRRWGLSADEAKSALIENKLPPEYSKEILPQFRSEVVSQVNRLIQFFFAATSYNRVHRIWLSGGGANLDQIAGAVEEQTGVVTKIANPFDYIQSAKTVNTQELAKNGPCFLTVFGLAIRED